MQALVINTYTAKNKRYSTIESYMQKLVLCFLGMFSIIMSVNSQNYVHAVGFRGSLGGGLTYRNYQSESMFNEFMLTSNNNYKKITFLHLMEDVFPGGYSERLYFNRGYGFHAGFDNNYEYRTYFGDVIHYKKGIYPVLGFDVYFGVEYHFEEFPFVVGLDYKPYFEFSTHQIVRLNLFDLGFSIKYKF